MGSWEKPLQPPVFWKENTSELTAQMKGSDRTLTRKLGLSQSLMVEKGAPNLNVTLKGIPKKFLGLFGQKAHKTKQITLLNPKEEVYP